MIVGPALIVISQCIDGHPNGAKAVLILGIIYTVASIVGAIIKTIAQASKWEDL